MIRSGVSLYENKNKKTERKKDLKRILTQRKDEKDDHDGDVSDNDDEDEEEQTNSKQEKDQRMPFCPNSDLKRPQIDSDERNTFELHV